MKVRPEVIFSNINSLGASEGKIQYCVLNKSYVKKEVFCSFLESSVRVIPICILQTHRDAITNQKDDIFSWTTSNSVHFIFIYTHNHSHIDFSLNLVH